MLRRALLLWSFVVLTLCSLQVSAWKTHEHTGAADVSSETVKVVRWEGSTDGDMLKQARSDIADATAKDSKIKTLRVSIMSGGGPAFTSMGIARIVREASDKGLIVEIHAEELCASGCTFVLASGTPGHRYMGKYALLLVHGLQDGSMFGTPTCIEHVDAPKTQEEMIDNGLYDLLRDGYARYTGVAPAEIEKWLTCGDERVGTGELAVKMHIADVAE